MCTPGGTFSADLSKDGNIDDRDALFILQAIEAAQSAYDYCGAVGQPPCVFNDRAICEDVSYSWTTGGDKPPKLNLPSLPSLPTVESSQLLKDQVILCPIPLVGGKP